MKIKRPTIRIAVVLLLLVSCKEKPSKQESQTAMQTTENVMMANFESFVEDAWNQGNMEKFKAVSVENYIRNLNGITVAENQNAVESNIKLFLTGFPDGQVTVDQIIQKDNTLFAHWTFIGTNTGIFGESPPTGKKVNVSGHSTIQFNENGKMIQEDVYYNELELLQQLGYTLVPPITE